MKPDTNHTATFKTPPNSKCFYTNVIPVVKFTHYFLFYYRKTAAKMRVASPAFKATVWSLKRPCWLCGSPAFVAMWNKALEHKTNVFTCIFFRWWWLTVSSRLHFFLIYVVDLYYICVCVCVFFFISIMNVERTCMY